MARVLTLAEVADIACGPMWMQEKGSEKTLVVTFQYEHIPYFMFQIHSIGVKGVIGRETRDYGKTWRCFEMKPQNKDLRKPFQE